MTDFLPLSLRDPTSGNETAAESVSSHREERGLKTESKGLGMD